jgi:hypothetical protein
MNAQEIAKFASTNPSDYSLSVALTNVATMRKPNQYIMQQILPPYPAPKLTGNSVWARDPRNDDLRYQDDSRAPGGESLSIYTGTPSVATTFAVPDHSLKDILPDELRSEYDTAIRAEADKTQKIVDKLLHNYEKEGLDLLATLTAGSPPTVKYDAYGSTATTSTGYNPIDHILSFYPTVEAAIGATPNSIAMDVETARKLIHNPRVMDFSKNVMPPAAVYESQETWKAMLRACLGIQNVYLAQGGFYNTGKKGQVASLSRMWSDNIALFYQEPPSVEYAGIGMTATYSGQGGGLAQGMKVEIGRLVGRSSDVIVVHWYRKPLLLNSTAGIWITDVLT